MHNCWCSHSARIANICRVTRACWQRHAIVTPRRARVVPRWIVGRSKPATPEAPVVWYCHSFFDPHAVADAGPREVSRRDIVETHIVAAQIIDVVEALLNVVDAPRALVEPAHFEYKVWGEGAVYCVLRGNDYLHLHRVFHSLPVNEPCSHYYHNLSGVYKTIHTAVS